MKIIGFTGSPRKEGNTAWIVNKILEGAKEQGAETELWHYGDLDINPCNACLACAEGEGCVIDDDMQKLYTALEQADALILGSPVYMGQMSAQAKTFTDRLFAHITPRFSPRFKEENAGKKLALVFTQGNPDSEKFKVYIDYTKSMFQMLEFDVRGLHIVAGTRNEPAWDKAGMQADMKDTGALLATGGAAHE